jgi:HD-GYP domain-containing protein (c-di-GMP phosphodiesterase class II)
LTVFKSAIETKELSANIELLLEAIEPPPNLIVCTIPAQASDASEIGQLLNSQYTGIPIFLVADKTSKLNRKVLLKNGYTDIYFFPMDRSIFNTAVEDIIEKVRKRGKMFKPIKIIDIAPGEKLEFDTFLFLAANNKHIKYSVAGDSLPKERTDKLKKHDIGALFISSKDTKKFYDYAAAKMKDVHGNPTMSETEKAEKMKSSVRDLFGNMFSESADSTESGKALVSEGQKIIKSFILQTTGKSTYERILAIAANNSDFYAHSSNVSSYASLFGLGLGVANIADIAMAALLHDLGLSKIPDDILAKDPEEWTHQEKEIYEKHVDYTMDVIREKKLILSDLTRKIITQHHEKYNASGYPKGIGGDRICIEAQIMSLADRFDYITAAKKGKKKLGPKDAMAKILADCSIASKMDFDPKLVKKIQALF